MKFNIEDNGIMYTGKAFYALVTLDSALPSNIDFNADNVFKIEIDEDTGHVSRMPIYVVDENYAFDEFSKTELARFINKEIDKIDLKLVIYTDYGDIKYVATSILTN